MNATIRGFLGTSLSLVGLYLFLNKAAGATSILRAAGSTLIGIFRTLQGRG